MTTKMKKISIANADLRIGARSRAVRLGFWEMLLLVENEQKRACDQNEACERENWDPGRSRKKMT
jgi:hypothetical protein